MDQRIQITPRFLWGLATALMLALGSFGPWATLGPFSVSGLDNGRDGIITLIIAIVAGVLICIRRGNPVTLLLGIAAAGVGIYDTANVSSAGNELFTPSVGWGLVMVDIAAVSLIVWAVVAILASRQSRATSDAAPSTAA